MKSYGNRYNGGEMMEKQIKEQETEYKKLYYELYENVSRLLVENKSQNYHPVVLLSKWDKIRS